MKPLLRLLIICTIIKTASASANRCKRLPTPQKFHLIGKCYRSKMATIAQANLDSLAKCKKLTTLRQGLAFNFSPPGVMTKLNIVEGERFFNCQVLSCPEFEIGLSLENDTRYDYYSSYADPLPRVNTTCFSSIGMFTLGTDRANYTDSIAKCRQCNSTLADASTETRTNALSTLIIQNKVKLAYVGMYRINGSDFKTFHNHSIECSTYRAWAPGHPKRHFRDTDCVAVDREKMWRVVKCSQKLPYVCELLANGPYRAGTLKTTRNANNTTVEGK